MTNDCDLEIDLLTWCGAPSEEVTDLASGVADEGAGLQEKGGLTVAAVGPDPAPVPVPSPDEPAVFRVFFGTVPVVEEDEGGDLSAGEL